MAVRHVHYLQLSPAIRKKAAQSSRERLANLVNMNPFLTPDQMVGIQAQIKQLSDWEKGCMNEGLAVPEPKLALPETTADRETPIMDMSHLASLIKKPESH